VLVVLDHLPDPLLNVSVCIQDSSHIDAGKGHKGEIEIESWGGVGVSENLELADQSSRAEVEVETSLNLDLEYPGERPSIDHERSVAFGDGERGKRPPPSD
jgi:hypothetical protein